MTSSDVIGSTYVTFGVFGVVSNFLTAVVILSCKDLRTITYYIMVQLCLSDCVTLFSYSIYAGIMVCFPNCHSETSDKIASYLMGVSWSVTCNMMLLASINRWLLLEHSHTAKLYMTNGRFWALSVAVFVASCLVCVVFLLVDIPPVVFDSYLQTWIFLMNSAASVGMLIFGIAASSFLGVLLVFFNVRSLLWIRRASRQIQESSSRRNTVKELKLFAQCAITSSLYIGVVLFYCVANSLRESHKVAFYVALVFKLSMHVQNPFIYFAINARLRRQLVILFEYICC